MAQTTRVIGSYRTEEEAIQVIEDLKRKGHDPKDISVLSKDRQETDAVTGATETEAGEGAATGAVAGGALGGLGGVLAGMGALAIPGIGPIVAAGPIAAGLTGAAAGAGVGGLAGALIGMGIPEEEAEQYETRFNEGEILVLLDEHGAGTGAAGPAAGQDTAALEENRFIDEHEEDTDRIGRKGDLL